MSECKKSLPIGEQLAGARALLDRITSALEMASAAHDAKRIAQLRHDRDVLAAIVTTLGWLTRDREGCVALLTTRWKIQGD